MLWFKAFHIISLVAWFAGLFYLPRLFVYHAEAMDDISIKRFKTMERRLYYGITWPSAILTTVLGISLLSFNYNYYLNAPWMHAKLTLVLLLWMYHLLCGHYLKRFAVDLNKRSTKFYRIYNELPTFLLVGIVIFVVVKPFG
ncbi:protoporphyrinogen oxidase HemJ [Legionella waltersii]|uniref:Protoporphyrinogen IX oxidase n=1 Tax=Legionella waltersii TaxID=66969 RepID=A0A0W1A1A9_9GAMM|nr:protoporphyrinogen oxidase HemJ [Legionella waltersii]KTD75062.1 transmembrane protein [Legionella waltersii]SNV05314.1 transmembrane protein [Legionella waltersii]